ncbi:MAG: TIM barrel protein [Rhizobiaceae bacterium]|nr:TIM barrel protein [Rhizobiaceae bacterium]
MCREFEIILDYAEQYDIFIGVEPEDANIVNSATKALRLLRHFPDSRIRIVFDPANIVENVPPKHQQRSIDEALDILGSKIIIAHAKDRTADGQIVPAGAGTIQWSQVVRGLSKAGFDGPLIAHGISDHDAPAVARYLGNQLRQL